MVNFLARKKEENNKKKNIIRNYDSTSEFYDNRYYSIQRQKFDISLRNMDFKNRIILDAGCGTGLFMEFFSNDSNKISLPHICVGVDISPKMLSILKTKFATKLKSENKRTHIILADLENIPLRTGVFDLIVSLTALQNLTAPEKGADELMRVSKNHANIILTILRKKLNIESMKSTLEKIGYIIELRDDSQIEDIIIRCKKR